MRLLRGLGVFGKNIFIIGGFVFLCFGSVYIGSYLGKLVNHVNESKTFGELIIEKKEIKNHE